MLTPSRRRPPVARALAAAATAAALLASACGGTAAPSPTLTALASASPSPAASVVASGPAASVVPSASASAAASLQPYAGPPATIEYSIWGDPQELKSQQRIVAAFMAANPGVTVKVTVSDWDSYWDKLQTGLAGGAAPDVFAMDGPLFPDYQARDVLLDLTPYITRAGFDLGTLAAPAVKDFTTADGRHFGLPRDFNVIALYYNKKMFDAAGLAYPDDSWDWQKLTDTATALTKRGADGKVSQWGFYTETTDMENYWSPLVWQNGGDILSADGKTTALGTPQAAGAIQFLQDLIWKQKVMPDPALFAQTGDAFEQGQAAMAANGSWLVPTYLAAGFDFGIAPLPKGPAGRVTSLNPTGAVVYKGTKSPDAAWAFVAYLASPVAQEQLMKLHAAVPVTTATLAGPYASEFDGATVFADAAGYAHLKPSFKGYNEFTTALQGELDANVFNEPKKTAAQALADVVPQLNQILTAGQ